MPTPHHLIQAPAVSQPRAKPLTPKQAAANLLTVYQEIYATIPGFAVLKDPALSGHLTGASKRGVTDGNPNLLDMARKTSAALLALEVYKPVYDYRFTKYARKGSEAASEAASANAADLRVRFDAALEVAVSKGIFSPQSLLPAKKSGHTK